MCKTCTEEKCFYGKLMALCAYKYEWAQKSPEKGIDLVDLDETRDAPIFRGRRCSPLLASNPDEVMEIEAEMIHRSWGSGWREKKWRTFGVWAHLVDGSKVRVATLNYLPAYVREKTLLPYVLEWAKGRFVGKTLPVERVGERGYVRDRRKMLPKKHYIKCSWGSVIQYP